MDTIPDENTIRTALNVYSALRRAQKKYRSSHSKENNQLSRQCYYRMKEDPERYAAYLEQRRNYQKQRREKKKQEAEEGLAPFF